MKKYYKYIVICFTATFFSYSQSLQDLKKMKSEYEILKGSQGAQGSVISNTPQTQTETNLPKLAKIAPYDPFLNIDNQVDEFNGHYGYDFFTKRDTVSFWESLPPTSNYILGSGDELIVSIWGETQLRQSYTISRDGKIYDDKVGILYLGGLTLLDAKNYLIKQFGKIYSTLNSSNPTSYIDITLGELRSINVNFVGEFKFPGIYPVHPFSSLITGIIQAGGVDTTGTLRNIQILRNEKIFSNVDLYDYFIKGSLPSKLQLRDQDVVLIPSRKSYVKIDSAVLRPGFYESLEGESIHDIIEFAGGVTYESSNKIGIKRIKPFSERINTSSYEGIYVDIEGSKSILAYNGDKITALKLYDDNQFVEIIGQVKAPGLYHYFPGMRFKDLIELSGGLSDTSYSKSVYLKQAEVVRRNTSDRYEKVFPVNIQDVLDNKNTSNIKLQNFDKIVVHANLNFFEKDNVTLSGEVNIPGSYPLTADYESLQSLIDRAGGLTTIALSNGIAIYRKKEYFSTEITNPMIFGDTSKVETEFAKNELDKKAENKIRLAWQSTKIALMPGDSIVVKEKTFTVYVTGSVYNPGVLEFRKGKSLNYYINTAGGLTDRANKKGIIVLYPNGGVGIKKWYRSPRVIDGSTIIVNQKLPEEPFNITQFATNWTSIVSSLISVVILSKQLQ